MKHNPYRTSDLQDENQRLQFDGMPGPWARRWWMLWIASYAFPFLFLFAVEAIDQTVKLPISDEAITVVFWGSFVVSLAGAIVSIFLSPHTILVRVALLLATLVAYPIGLFVLGVIIGMLFGFSNSVGI